VRRVAAVAALLLVAVAPAAGGASHGGAILPASFTLQQQGPNGGALWTGMIPSSTLHITRPSLVYLPPGASTSQRYPLFVILHGIPGSPASISDGLQLASVADAAIASHQVRPFIAVAPPAGPSYAFRGEWTGSWERYVVSDVLPWAESHLPVIPGAAGRAVGGLSAGGYGAVDIGLRHPGLFGTLEAWSGYFQPIRDGDLRNASRAVLDAHDPTLLARSEAPLLQRLGTRFYLSCATTHDKKNASFTRAFARELAALRLPSHVLLAPGRHDAAFWRSQLPAALAYGVGSPGAGP
jgi:enterochelin esterase-like enzyme